MLYLLTVVAALLDGLPYDGVGRVFGIGGDYGFYQIDGLLGQPYVERERVGAHSNQSIYILVADVGVYHAILPGLQL